MSEDARFEDAPFADRPLRLAVMEGEDLQVVSALVQDAVGKAGDIKWLPRRRRLVVLLNRFRWEDAEAAKNARRPFERVRTALTIENVARVRARGIGPGDPDVIFSLLSLAWAPGDDGTGTLTLTIAGDGDLAVEVEALDASLSDLTQPWVAPSGKAPGHAE